MAMTAEARLDAQTAIIGSMLIDGSIAGGLMLMLQPEDFSDQTARTIFEAARKLYVSGDPLDPVAVLSQVGKGYEPYMREAMRLTPTAANWELYARKLREDRLYTDIQRAAGRIMAADTLEDARTELQSATQLLSDRPGIRCVSFEQMMIEFVQRMESKEPPKYLDFGIEKINRVVKSEAGDFIILAADSSVGKTAFACQLAFHMASTGHRVGFFSFETKDKKLADRIIAQRARVPMKDIKNKTVNSYDSVYITKLGMAASSVALDVINSAGMTAEDIASCALAKRYDVIFVDYVQLISAAGQSRWEIVTNISMALHTFAQRCGVTVIGLSQVSPAGKGAEAKKAITKDDIRESRQLKQDADVIITLSLTDPSDYGSDRLLVIDKNKDGPCGKMELVFDAQFMDFYPAHGDATKESAFTEVQEVIPFEDRR